MAFTLPPADRTPLTVYFYVVDTSGNISAIVSDDIEMDFYPPMPHSTNFRLCADVVDSGGSTGLLSSSYTLNSAIGQPFANASQNSDNFREQSGFLADTDGCLPIERAAPVGYNIWQWVVGAGGSQRDSASYTVADTVGETVASETNSMSSQSFVLSSGFWAQTAVQDTVVNPDYYVYLPMILR